MTAVSKPDVGAAVGPDEAKTRYPLVLAHGMAGFSTIGPVHYWHGIVSALRAKGASVHVTGVSAFNSSEVRGEQLLAQVRRILADTGASKVHLIGHSHGSHSARYVAGLHPDWVASVTAVSGPVKGSPVADSVYRLSRAVGPLLTKLGTTLVNGLGHLTAFMSLNVLPQDSYGTLMSLTQEGAARFNAAFPAGVPLGDEGDGAHEVGGVRFYSWSGVGQFYNPWNPFDYISKGTGRLFKGQANDGLVGRCSSHLGMIIRDDYRLNHFHAVNQLMGLVAKEVDPVALFVEHAQRLKQAGL